MVIAIHLGTAEQTANIRLSFGPRGEQFQHFFLRTLKVQTKGYQLIQSFAVFRILSVAESIIEAVELSAVSKQ